MVFGGGTRQSWGWGRGGGGETVRCESRCASGNPRVGSGPGVASRDAPEERRVRAPGRTRARGEDAGAPNPDVGVSGRARGDGTGTTRAGDGRTSSSSDFSRMRSSRSLCVSRSCFLSAACARARRGWSGSIAAPASPSASGSNSGLAPSSYSGPSELLMARRGLGDRGFLSRWEARRGRAPPSRARGGVAGSGRGESTNGSNFSLLGARDHTRRRRPKTGHGEKFPSRSRRSRARLVAPSSERTARVTRRRLRRARTPVELVPRRAGHHAAQEEEG